MEHEASKLQDCYTKITELENLLSRLNRIGITLSAEKDTNNLLNMILQESMEITNCDGGSIYIKVEKDGKSFVKFHATRNVSRSFPFKEFYMPIDSNSISGYCAYSGKPFNFSNMDEVPKHIPGLHYNDYFDKQINYKTVNMMVIPMKDYQEEIVGVLQLINKKKNLNCILDKPEEFAEYITPFTKGEEKIILSLASQTAILLERSKLMEEIQRLFDTFVESMVTTIEKRDPTTSGHSIRVAKYVTSFAEAINNANYSKYKDLYFNEENIQELRYAGLLHDVGKIGISESVLQKQNRLTDEELKTVLYRFAYFKKDLEVKQLKGTITEEETGYLDKLDEYGTFIAETNKKGFITDEENARLLQIADIQFIDVDRVLSRLLTEHEVKNLTVKRGNLTDEERNQMNMHAAYTYQILKDIPWVKYLSNIPKIAADHHEKLNGFGYPNKLTEEQILVQSKMLAIIDIFEALTAIDRPYKKAMPVDKALKILEEEVSRNSLDKDLFEIFMKEELYKVCLKQEEQSN